MYTMRRRSGNMAVFITAYEKRQIIFTKMSTSNKYLSNHPLNRVLRLREKEEGKGKGRVVGKDEKNTWGKG